LKDIVIAVIEGEYECPISFRQSAVGKCSLEMNELPYMFDPLQLNPECVQGDLHFVAPVRPDLVVEKDSWTGEGRKNRIHHSKHRFCGDLH
jgi:hypothetical protein